MRMFLHIAVDGIHSRYAQILALFSEGHATAWVVFLGFSSNFFTKRTSLMQRCDVEAPPSWGAGELPS